MYTLLKFFQYSGDNGDDDENEKKKKMLFKIFCFSTIAALTIATVMSWTNNSNISEVISSNIDINQSNDENIGFTYDLSQYITEDMKVDKTKWDPEFDVNNIDYDHLEKYSLDELRQLIDAFDNDSIPYNKDLCNMVCDYVIDHS